ncbi:MAG: AhpA/YtjB family protein [Alteromonadaceae bacterium]|jgi:membrane protein
MTQTAQPLYPKLSPIYNKIMQLAIAIAFIVILMNLWIYSQTQNKQSIEQHFYDVGQQYLQQASAGLSVLTPEVKTQQSRQLLQNYIDELQKTAVVEEIHLYDLSGQLIISSQNAKSIKALFGLSDNQLDNSKFSVPFVSEVRKDVLVGYVRLTLDKHYLTTKLLKNNDEQFTLLRLMMIIAGVVGFLLTRGLNRFSRQGFRLGNTNKKS